jgi:serine/threonine protein kinase
VNDVANRFDLSSGDFIGNYCIESTLGEGAYGKVFKVKDFSGKLFALKILKLWAVPVNTRKNVTERFDMEFETGQIESNYLVRSLSYGYHEGVPYFVMEYCPKGNLMKLIGSRNMALLIRASKEILYGLRDLHRNGKVHRDLKPENVLFKADGTAALTDFGIAGDRNKRMTEMGTRGGSMQIFGTYAFMPPEQVNGIREATVLPTTDIFSFGAMLYLIVTGKLPFGKLNRDKDLMSYLANSREGLWNKDELMKTPLGRIFCPVIEGCLRADFRKRFQTVDRALELMPATITEDAYRPALGASALALKQPEPERFAQLRIIQGEEMGKVYNLNELLLEGSNIITVGRADVGTNNMLNIREIFSNHISRRHCTLELDSDTSDWFIRDGQWDKHTSVHWRRSTNGTFVNATEIGKNGVRLIPGDTISIGEVKLRFETY